MTGRARGGRPPTSPSSADPDAAGTGAFNMAFLNGVTSGRVPFGVADELAWYYDAPGEPSNVHLEARVPGPQPGICVCAVRNVQNSWKCVPRGTVASSHQFKGSAMKALSAMKNRISARYAPQSGSSCGRLNWMTSFAG